jgi:hypothetical protein
MKPRQLEMGTRTHRVETRKHEGGKLFARVKKNHTRANGFSPRPFCFVWNGSEHGRLVRVGVQALA